MKVAFISPAEDRKRRFFYRLSGAIYGGHPNPITGPLVLGAILKKAGHEVRVYEELFRDIDFSELQDAEVVGLYTMSSNAPRAYELADRFRQANKRVIIGGMHASALPEEALEHADQVVVGEAEQVIRGVVEGDFSEPIVRAEPVRDLDQIPFADYTLLRSPCTTANVLSARGCPNRCSYCTTTRMYHPYRQRSPEHVIAELVALKEQGFRYVYFQDDNFAADRDRAKQILREMIDRDLTFKETFFFGRADLALDEELIELLSRARFRRMLLGIESLNPASLSYVNKNQTPELVRECCEKLRRHRIKLIASLVIGLDFDTPEDVARSVALCKSVDAYQLQPGILTPFPGTPVYEQFEAEGRFISKDWSHYDLTRPVFRPVHFTPYELQREFVRCIARFYTFWGALRVGWHFGLEAGLRRLGMWVVLQIAAVNFYIFSRWNNGNVYNALYRMDRGASGEG